MISIDTDASEKMLKLSASIKKFGNFREPMLKWVRYMQNETEKLFANNALGGTYNGITWEYFSDRTLNKLEKGYTVYRYTRPNHRTKLKYGDRILQHTGQLKKSLTNAKLFRITNNAIEFGSTVDYAFYHQLGTRYMPDRPVLFATDKNIEYFDRLITQHINKSLRSRDG